MALTRELVAEFVLVSHNDFSKATALLAQVPDLLNARYEKVNEDALQAAGHMGFREMAGYLLAKGAPLQIFAASTLGLLAEVKRFLHDDPQLANAKGVHGIPLFYHAALSGRVDLLDTLYAAGGRQGMDFALHGAVRPGHLEAVAWLLTHDLNGINRKNFEDKTPLKVAAERGYGSIADLLITAQWHAVGISFCAGMPM